MLAKFFHLCLLTATATEVNAPPLYAELRYFDTGCSNPFSSYSSVTLISSYCQFNPPPGGSYTVTCLADKSGGTLSFGCDGACGVCTSTATCTVFFCCPNCLVVVFCLAFV